MSRPMIRVTGRASAEYLLADNAAGPPVDRIPIGTYIVKMRGISQDGGVLIHSVHFVRQLFDD